MSRVVVCVVTCSVLAANVAGQTIVTGFEPGASSPWPMAPWSLASPSPAAIQAAGITYTFEKWELWRGDTRHAFIGSQGARATQPMPYGSQPGSRLAVGPLQHPTHVVFKMAASALVEPGALPDWALLLTARSATGTSQLIGYWTNERNSPLAGPAVMTRIVATLGLPPGTFTLEFSLASTAAGGSPPFVMLDDLEIYTTSDPPPPYTVPLHHVERLLDAAPPGFPMSGSRRAERQWLIDQLDRHALAHHQLYQFPGGPGWTTPFTRWFRRRLKAAAEHLAGCEPGPAEACITKLYSSAFVVHTRDGTFAVDLTAGPTQDNLQLQVSEAMAADPQTLNELAKRMDFLLITHHHRDHASFPMVYMMWLHDHPVYGPARLDPADPQSLTEYFAAHPSAPGLCAALPSYCAAVAAIIDSAGATAGDVAALKVGPRNDWSLRTFKGVQVMNPAVPWGAPQPLSSPINHAYHVTSPDGLRFLIIGDQRDYIGSCPELDSVLDFTTATSGWWPRLWSSGLSVDVKLGAGPFISSPVWTDRLTGFFSPLLNLHGHEWEMTHASINRASRVWNAGPAESMQVLPLTIGEHLHFRAFSEPPHLSSATSTTATISLETALPVIGCDVRYRLQGGSYGTATSTTAAPSRRQSVTLTGLSPLSTYEYHVTCRSQALGSNAMAPVIPIRLTAGPRYGSATRPLRFSTR